MKIKFLLSALAVIMALSFALSPDAFGQGKGKPKGPPPWAPAHGYRAKTRHIYFPQHNFYFDVLKGVYLYLNGGKWETVAQLPLMFAGIDLKTAAKVELELDSDAPYKLNADHQVKYKTHSEGGPGKTKGNHGKGKSKKK